MPEPCKNCGRVECPRLKVKYPSDCPHSEKWHTSGVACYACLTAYEDAKGPAIKDCEAHTVDWRQRALEFKAEMEAAKARADDVLALRAENARLREAIGRLPEVKHAGDCTTHVTSLRREYGCDCGADTANAARAEARKAAGLE